MLVLRYLHQAVWKYFSFILILALLPHQGKANVIINGTRIIYPQQKREVNIQLSNDDNKPSLIQAWIDKGDADSHASFNNIAVPFILTPPIIRVEPNTGQTLRVTWTGSPLPQDRESLFWLNILDIPPKNTATPESNILQMAIRSRMKIFFRPPALTADGAVKAYHQLRWQRPPSAAEKTLRVNNPSAYFISVSSIKIITNGKETKSLKSQMIAPKSFADFRFTSLPEKIAEGSLSYEVINDYGSVTTIK